MRRRALIPALIGSIALGLAGCTTIPMQGPVADGSVNLVESNPLYLQVYGPVADATPEQIVRGFLTAQAGGASDNFATARKFLSGQAGEVWDPSTQITVFSGDLALAAPVDDEEPPGDAPKDVSAPQTEPDTTGSQAGAEPESGPGSSSATINEAAVLDGLEDGSAEPSVAEPSDSEEPSDEPSEPAPSPTPETEVTLVGHLEVNGTVDESGRYTEAAAGATQDVTFTLVKDSASQWRISKAGDGVLILEPNFVAGYRSANIYFLSPDGEFLIPETRWFPQRNTATYVTKALLAGPSTWLRDAVRTAIPMGTRLAIDAVAIDGTGTANVELTAAVLDAEPDERGFLVAQIEATLMRLPGVSGVQVLANGTPLSVNTSADPARDPLPRTLPLGIRDGQIVQLSGRTVNPLNTFASVGDRDVTAIGLGESGWPVVVRNGTNTLELVPEPNGVFAQLMTGPGILAPSIDRFGWVWSGSQDVEGALRVLQPGNPEHHVTADWLEEQELVAVKVSRDGTRVAIISEIAGRVEISVTGIVRDESGAPQGLSAPIPVGASLTSALDLVWIDEVTLAVLGQSSTVRPLTVHIVPIGAHSSALTPVDGAAWLASGRGQRTLFVGTKDGQLWSRGSTGTNWSLVASGIDAFSFSG